MWSMVLPLDLRVDPHAANSAYWTSPAHWNWDTLHEPPGVVLHMAFTLAIPGLHCIRYMCRASLGCAPRVVPTLASLGSALHVAPTPHQLGDAVGVPA